MTKMKKAVEFIKLKKIKIIPESFEFIITNDVTLDWNIMEIINENETKFKNFIFG